MNRPEQWTEVYPQVSWPGGPGVDRGRLKEAEMSRTMRRPWRVLTPLLASLSLTAAAFVPGVASAQATRPGAAACPWLGQGQPVAARVRELLSAMTLTQKLAEMHAFDTTSTGPYAGYEGYVPAQPSLCIPALPEQDDSLGVGAGATGVTQLPAAGALLGVGP